MHDPKQSNFLCRTRKELPRTHPAACGKQPHSLKLKVRQPQDQTKWQKEKGGGNGNPQSVVGKAAACGEVLGKGAGGDVTVCYHGCTGPWEKEEHEPSASTNTTWASST